MPNEKTIHIVTLGCARNQVDSEVMAGELHRAGWTRVDRPETARVIVVNTCSFIEAAADEAIDTILALAEFKQTGVCRRLVVTGCLPQRYGKSTGTALSEVDVFLGTGAYDRIVAAVEEKIERACLLPDPDAIDLSGHGEKRLLPAAPAMYLKIAEGCNRHCTYCIIPALRGRQKSRPAADILKEARIMLAAGVREMVLVAQESTHYGADLPASDGLAGLLRDLATLAGAGKSPVWIRVLYGHPESIDTDLIESFATTPGVLPYFDIPIQHASDRILKKMGRKYDAAALRDLFEMIRSRIPAAVLRTTVITGFPGETKADFSQLLALADEIRFDHLGVFTYSDADDLAAHALPDPVPAETARDRMARLMTLQKNISREKNEHRLGRKVDVLVEEMPEPGLWMGRTAFQAPEVDGVTYVHADNGPAPAVGSFVRATIIDAMAYDLVATVDAQKMDTNESDFPRAG